MGNKRTDAGEAGVSIPIEWHLPEGKMTPFATNMVVQNIENLFKISFFEIRPSIQFDKSIPPPSKVRADCVASIIVTPDKLSKFIEVLLRQLEEYSKKQT